MPAKHDFHELDLDPRAREVLREIVMQHIESGDAISSRTLAKCGRFDLSPASLRNVMADLEDLGYLAQPHTSAGRVPTDRGYRFFINHLMKSRSLSAREREVIDDQVSHAHEIDEVLHLASNLLWKLSDQVGVVFMPTLLQFAIRSMDFVLVAENKIMCILVGVNGVVVNKIVETRFRFTRDELEKISRFSTAEFSGCTLDLVRRRLVRMTEQERAQHDEMLQKTISLGIEAVNAPIDHDLYVEGAESILNKPEFADAALLRKTFLALQEKERLVEILESCLQAEGLQILVGSESDFTGDHNFSIVARRYGSQSTPNGMVAIIGPMRMEYARMAPLVDYLGRALSRKIEEQEQPR
ncbi:MAG: heat-inducible transcription repressor HrcA [Acidobacteria bacterium]|nr:heat-inducible transcription repressor HrcA [Acidobacteriota bacterium]MBV9478404.1 heat-inducible transcription repressor HrcA [Acidobacteriota bacterium]